MNHFTLDAFRGYRSRLDDLPLVYEILEEIPIRLGLKPVMPPFVLPYYNGVIPEDCGISGFVFLAGGHFTIHTFSFRESYFVDVFHPGPFDPARLEKLVLDVFPAEKRTCTFNPRGGRGRSRRSDVLDIKKDFGPHLMMDFDRLKSIPDLDDLFDLFDHLPHKIGMTPIMRPYGVRTRVQGETLISAMTMIAESHISVHIFPKRAQAYLDLFSCSFFEVEGVSRELRKTIDGTLAKTQLVSRGKGYKILRTNTDQKTTESRVWLKNVFSSGLKSESKNK